VNTKYLKEIFCDIQSILAIIGFVAMVVFTALDLLLFAGGLSLVRTFSDIVVTIIVFYFASRQVKKQIEDLKKQLEK
jgi:hypothetical protein